MHVGVALVEAGVLDVSVIAQFKSDAKVSLEILGL